MKLKFNLTKFLHMLKCLRAKLNRGLKPTKTESVRSLKLNKYRQQSFLLRTIEIFNVNKNYYDVKGKS